MSSQPTIFRIITPEDVAGDTEQAAARGPGLLFVECNGQDGRIENRIRPLVNRHVMLNHVYQETTDVDPTKREMTSAPTSRQASQDISGPSLTPAESQPQSRKFTFVVAAREQRKRQPRKSARVKQSQAKSHTVAVALSSTPPPAAPISPICAVEDVCKWWFDARSDLRSSFDVAKTHWVESAWNMARRSDTVYECVALYAARKKAMRNGVWSAYFAQEVRCIRSMSDEVQKQVAGPRPLLPVAIGVLAYLALLDHRVDIAVTHLQAIKSLWGPLSFEDTRHEWVYVAWLDLRFAIHLGRAPILDYFISAPFRDLPLPELSFDLDQVSSDMAEHCAWLCPQSDILETYMAIRLFKGIFELFFAWSALTEAEQTPFGRIYDLDYWLCTLRSKVLPIQGDGAMTPAMAVELVLTTMQIHIWIVTRFWAPVGTASRELLLARACRLIASIPTSEFITLWKDLAECESLLWILSTVTACAIEVGIDSSEVPIELLRLTTDSLGIRDVDTFSVCLKEWPWIENWHQVKYAHLWDMIDRDSSADLNTNLIRLQITEGPTMLGGLEFYDE